VLVAKPPSGTVFSRQPTGERMNKRVFSLLSIVLTALCFSSQAGATQFGVRLGGLFAYNASAIASFGGQYVANDLIGPYTDVRVIASIGFNGGFPVIQLQTNLMFRFTLDDAGNTFVYIGPGVGLAYKDGDLRFNLLARGGLEYQFTPNLSAFTDLGAGYILNYQTYLELAIGLNFRLIETAG
jgi:hypothetical protein